METSKFVVGGDTPGISWSVPVLQFKGSDPSAPTTYMQGALHADELPGSAVLHFLCEKLRRVEKENRLLGDITIVPQANPLGLAQMPLRQMQGRFDITTGTNFNRDFPRIALAERETLLSGISELSPADQLKNHLLYLALGADIVIDLHCDYEALLYTYVCQEFWPDAKDFASAMKLDAVFIADGQSTAFDEAVSHAFARDENGDPPRRLATTLELRGQSAVSETLAKSDADRLINFLTGRGAVGGAVGEAVDWRGKAVPLDFIEVVGAPVAGTVLLEKNLGEVVRKGDVLAKIISAPGIETGIGEVTAPRDGRIVSRMTDRFAVRGQQVYKLICDGPSKEPRKPGTLEN